jgi:hypothetical protein
MPEAESAQWLNKRRISVAWQGDGDEVLEHIIQLIV